MTIKKIFGGFFLLLALMWLSGELLLKSDERSSAKHSVVLEATTSEAVLGTTTSLEAASSPQKEKQLLLVTHTEASSTQGTVLPLPPVASTATGSKEIISATLLIEGKTFTHLIPSGSSVASLLAVAQDSGEITFIGKEYSGLGMLIVGLNGKENNMNKNNLYWIYSVNGKKATKGVSQYQLSAGDAVSWSYEANTY